MVYGALILLSVDYKVISKFIWMPIFMLTFLMISIYSKLIKMHMGRKGEEILSGKALEKLILWCGLAAMILILYMLLSSAFYGGEFSLLDNLIDSVAIFIGALLGALVTGKIANDIHVKEFKRLEIKDSKASFLVQQVLRYYTSNIDRALEDAKTNANVYRSYVDLLKSGKKFSEEEERDLKNGMEGIKCEMIRSIKEISKEYNELCEVNVENLELEYLVEFLKYRSLMHHTTLPIIEKTIKYGIFTEKDYAEVKEINTEILKLTNK